MPKKRAKPRAICSMCREREATCIGAYEGETRQTPGCDECCGHGNEDGACVSIATAAPPRRKTRGKR